MSEESPMFILAGNGPYENRGCEAIVRGTANILRKHYRNPRFICFSHFQSKQQYQTQYQCEKDGAIIHLASYTSDCNISIQHFWRPEECLRIFKYLLIRSAFYKQVYHDMLPYLENANAVLSIGGDNYSLDYGIPKLFTALDDIAIQRGTPLILWGASVGPFSTIPKYERYMEDHLRGVTGIFARESVTKEYLRSIGVTKNVYSTADPAFCMDAIKPIGIDDEMPLEEESIGINLSPLMSKYVTGGNLEQWTKISSHIIETIAQNTEMPVYLIPHVTSAGSNDYEFMQRALSMVQMKKKNIILVNSRYNAAEVKWIISKMTLFAGSRTHSTIASLSSGVPTLSFAYSIKAQGINKDIFGHTAYCLGPKDIDIKTISSKVIFLLDQGSRIRGELDGQIPAIQKSACSAGIKLQQIIEET